MFGTAVEVEKGGLLLNYKIFRWLVEQYYQRSYPKQKATSRVIPKIQCIEAFSIVSNLMEVDGIIEIATVSIILQIIHRSKTSGFHLKPLVSSFEMKQL